jgi:hypothetical protein
VNPVTVAALCTTSRTVARVCRATRSDSVPRSGLASIAMIRSSRVVARAMPSSVVTVVLPTPPLRVRIGTNRVPPSNCFWMRASSSLRALSSRESPRFSLWNVAVYTSLFQAPVGGLRCL